MGVDENLAHAILFTDTLFDRRRLFSSELNKEDLVHFSYFTACTVISSMMCYI
jgi:hypothetical protein